MKARPDFRIKRVYDPVSAADGLRVLVDRLWPRGVSKEKATIDLWLKDITPSTRLRQWFHDEPSEWETFSHRYRLELEQQPLAVQQLLDAIQGHPVTLITAVKDTKHSHLSVLLAFLQERQALLKK